MSLHLYHLLTVRIFIFAIFSGILCSCSTDNQPSGTFDIFIADAKIFDGTGDPAYTADLLIRGDSIAFIGNVDEGKISVQRKIDARGKVLSPGFIDAHAHGDPLATPGFENFLNMGVTTICLGQDGFSYESANLLPWIQQIDSLGVGVNVLTFIGHSTLRSLSGTNYAEEPTSDQLQRMVDLLSKGFGQGAFGMSTGLEYTPGYYAQAPEMAELAKAVGAHHGIIMSHMRNEDDNQIEKSIHELLMQGQYAPVHISHFKVVFGNGAERARHLLSILDSARQAGTQVTADVYPYMASYTSIGIVFPEWAKAPNDYRQVVASRRKELKQYLHDKVLKRNGPEATLLGNEKWKGMNLKQIADSLQLSFEDVLIDIIGPEGASGAYFVMDEALQSALIQDSLVCISSDGSPTMHHPRGYGSFAKVIGQYVNETNSLTLAEAIRKMTSLPASIIGIKNRGFIKVGKKADLLIFDPALVKDVANYEDPHQMAEGMDYIIINGALSKAPGKINVNLNGSFLSK
ncbi:MAG TPA: amidohydrolase family protein [Cyclobacteriaceae bacterium]